MIVRAPISPTCGAYNGARFFRSGSTHLPCVVTVFRLRFFTFVAFCLGAEFAHAWALPLPEAAPSKTSASIVAGDRDIPNEFWWYWDRPASQLPSPAAGVGAAVVVTHVYLSGDRALRVPRRSALPLPADVIAIPVIHVEVDPARPFAATVQQRDALRDAVIEAGLRGRPPWVQLDFEARLSQREFWRATVQEIRARLPADIGLSVTALASWCHGDRWLADIVADEVVPMYFRLGSARAAIIARSAAGVAEPRCARAHGVADDEPPWPVALPGRRYVFLGTRPRQAAAKIALERTR
ncbi:hypothetical protein BH11PSE11_BH11PSE11_29160 [soil metagenome]